MADRKPWQIEDAISLLIEFDIYCNHTGCRYCRLRDYGYRACQFAWYQQRLSEQCGAKDPSPAQMTARPIRWDMMPKRADVLKKIIQMLPGVLPGETLTTFHLSQLRRSDLFSHRNLGKKTIEAIDRYYQLENISYADELGPKIEKK